MNSRPTFSSEPRHLPGRVCFVDRPGGPVKGVLKLNKYLDALPTATFRAGNASCPAFKAFILAGIIFGCLLIVMLAIVSGRSVSVASMIAIAALLACYFQAIWTKVVTGAESSIYYHQLILIIVIVALVAHILGQPPMPFLEMTILGMAVVQIIGRIGCLVAGCCHGLPHRFGVCYREEHARQGFPPYLVGVRLFPIQLVESVWVLIIMIIGCLLLFTQATPGSAFAWYIVAYGSGRFSFEFFRGDPERPYLFGFSEAQWISVALISAVVAAEQLGVLPLALWHAPVLGGLGFTMIAVCARRRFARTAKHLLLHPRHVDEVARLLALVSIEPDEDASPATDSGILVGQTSLGVRLSVGRLADDEGVIEHYTLSASINPLTHRGAATLAELILRLKSHCGSSELISGKEGFFHLLVRNHPGDEAQPARAGGLVEEPSYGI